MSRDEDRAKLHVTVNGVLLILLAGLCGLMFLSGLVNLALTLTGFGVPTLDWASASDSQRGELVGRMAAFAYIILGCSVEAVWSGVAAFGLLTGRRWGRKSALGAWIASIPLCGCLPLAAYGLYSLTRPAVRARLAGGR